jgi:hypothetical protein
MSGSPGGPSIAAPPKRRPEVNAGWTIFTGADLRQWLEAIGMSQRGWAKLVGMSERGCRSWIASKQLPATVVLLMRYTEMDIEMAEIIARMKPGKLVPSGVVRGLYARYGLRPPVVKAKPVKPPKPVAKPAKRPKRVRHVGRTYDADVAYNPRPVETPELRMARMLSIPLRTRRPEDEEPPPGF